MIFDSLLTFGICFLTLGVLFIEFIFVKPKPTILIK